MAFSIAHIDSEPRDFRGGQEALLILARGLRARGHKQVVVSPEGSALGARAREEGFETAPLSGLRALVREGGVQVIHAHSARAQNIAFLASAGLTGVCRVVSRHVAFPPRNRLVHWLKYSLTCDAIVAVSEAVRQVLLASGVAAEKTHVIPTGVEIPATLPERGAERADFVIGHMGAFTAEKGQDVAVDALILLGPELPRARLVLAGEGPLKAAVQARAEGAGARVSFPGFVSDRAGFLASLDLFVMPSRQEGWGLAALEAMAHGVPVVASAAGGLTEIVDPGSGGWLVPPDNPRALAEAIAEAASDPVRLNRERMRARERAGLFSAEQTAALTETLYQRIVPVSRA